MTIDHRALHDLDAAFEGTRSERGIPGVAWGSSGTVTGAAPTIAARAAPPEGW